MNPLCSKHLAETTKGKKQQRNPQGQGSMFTSSPRSVLPQLHSAAAIRARKKKMKWIQAPLTRSMFTYTSLYSVRALLFEAVRSWTASVHPYFSIKRSELFPLRFLLGASTTTYHEIPCMKVPVCTMYVIIRTRESDCDEEYEYA